jgi:hypothetical protein
MHQLKVTLDIESTSLAGFEIGIAFDGPDLPRAPMAQRPLRRPPCSESTRLHLPPRLHAIDAKPSGERKRDGEA